MYLLTVPMAHGFVYKRQVLGETCGKVTWGMWPPAPEPAPAAAEALTVAHEGLAAPFPALVRPPAVLPQRRSLHVGQGLRLQPAPARQGDDPEDDSYAQEQG